MYAPEPFTVYVPTKYYGVQPIRVTAYLPYVESEYDAAQPMTPFGSHYTTGAALRSTQHAPFGLFPTIEVVATDGVGTLSELTGYPFASIMPSGSQPDYYDGSFSLLHNLNDQANANTPNPIPSIYGVTALHVAQRFFKFTTGLLDHKGIDKAGAKLVRIILRDTKTPYEALHFDDRSEFYINIEDNVHDSYISRTNLASSMTFGMALDLMEGEPTAGEAVHIINAFAKIMGLAFVNFEKPGEPFSNPGWSFGYEPGIIEAADLISFDNPKQYSVPSTYKGEFWQDNSGPENFNDSVLTLLFYYLNVAKSGHIDDDESRSYFSTEPLITGNKYATYALALKLFYRAIVGKINTNSTFSELRFRLLQAAIAEGHLPGSPVFERVMTACAAVGIGELPYDSNYNCSSTKTADSWFNGPVQYNVAHVTLEQDPTSKKAILLTDCTSEAFIKTAELDPLIPEKYNVFINKTPDQGELYGKEKDLVKSKVAISVHAHSITARDWFRDRFGHLGMDGLGKIGLLNCIGNSISPGEEIIPSSNEIDLRHTFSFKSACRDDVFRRYTQAIFISRDYPSYVDTDQGEEAKILSSGLSSIFGLTIKRDFEKKKLNPDADEIWQLYEELGDATQVRSFPQPKLHGQVSVYHGNNWVPGDTRVNSGFLQLFFYLLVHGTKSAEGYKNDEPGSLTYFVNPLPEDLVVKVLWNASRTVSYDPTIEEFRMATLTELHKLDPVKYHAKSKEHISIFDAWAAVLGLPDYASGLAHFPEDDAVVYPWAVKVGVEAEYPVYESYRLFEVSTSMAFNDNVAPVYRFVNSSAPDLETGMTYGYINLEPGKYFVRSHLAQGPDSRAHCEATNDPAFCESLLGKEKWTLPYPFTAGPVPAPVTISPLKGETVPAWSGFFSFGSVAGAMGYDMHVKDPQGTAAEHTIAVDIPYDEDDQSSVTKKLALSAKKPYSYAVAGKQKLGSEKAVHVLPGGLLQLLTEAEKEQFPTIYSDWTEEISFETDMPTISLHSPADQDSIPLFGEDVVLRSTRLTPDRADYYQFYLKEPFYESPALTQEEGFAHFAIHVPGLQGVEDKKGYHWAIVPRKKAELPFIVEEEEGEVVKWHRFIVTKNLAPKPEVDNIDCVEAGSEPVLHWKPVPGAQTYKLTGVDGATQTELGAYQTGQLAGKLSNMSTFPNKYIYKVAAGIMGGNGEWIFGPEAVGDYSVVPPSPSNLAPNNVSGVILGENNSVHFSWELPAGVTEVHLFARDEDTEQVLLDHFIVGDQVNLNHLEFDHDIFWSLQSQSPDKSCVSKEVTAIFHTEPAPDEFDFGFELRVDNDDPKIFGGLYHYSIRVIRPDGNVDFTGIGTVDADTWLQVGFVPEMGQVINGNEMNGQLTDQQGDYLIELEIIDMFQCQNCPDVNAHPKIKVRGMEYIRKNGESSWKLNKSVQPQPSDPEFPSRTIGAKKLIKLHYNLP
ncbi:gluzincin family metallopeptidase [Dyadobacter aurulentus]|uniref:hypothetical protein n=1 Tax=Dyadobacter sp. UC 10 TaxID=2605428 RepID=UPI0011F3ED95|nr:hypothetical protein [Dyadobacter sp. UC 10]KAA0993668.1 hypothetical protein FXO21_27575 [Dyadobacter sp. UC 10]